MMIMTFPREAMNHIVWDIVFAKGYNEIHGDVFLV